MTALFVRLAALVAVFASIFLVTQLVLASYLNRRSEGRAVNRRLELLKSGISTQGVAAILRKNAPDRLLENAALWQRVYFRFQRNVRMSAIRFEPPAVLMVCSLAFATLASLILLFAWSAKFPITAGVIELIVLIAGSAAFVLPVMFIARMAEKQRKRMEEQFPVSLDIFTRALRAGHPVSSAIDLLTREMEDPLGSEFGLVADEVAYGASLTDSLSSMGERWELNDIRMFVTSLSLQSETGGNLAEILGNLSGVIRDRASMYMKVRALSSEGRMSAWMLSVLPVLTILSMFAANPAFYLEVATDPMFIIGFSGMVVLYIIGVFIIRHMVDLKV
jgi:tight adherence protein B